MNNSRYFLYFICFFFLLILGFPRPAVAITYEELSNQLKSKSQPDTMWIQELPEPDSARDYRLRAEIQPTFRKALEDYWTGFELSGDSEEKNRLLTGWLKVALLNPDEAWDVRTLLKAIEQLASSHGVSNKNWFLSAQYLRIHGESDDALEYYRNIHSSSSLYFPALINQAEIELQRGNHAQAKKHLREYFLHPDRPDEPRYWLLKGKYFRDTGSDSEAYITYSHVINHYPEHFLRSKAEKRISDLSLPKPLYPDSTADQNLSKNNQTGTSAEKPSTNQRNFKKERFQVQAGSFRDRSHARSLKRSLEQSLDRTVVIRESVVNGKNYYRVRIRGLASRRQASELIKRLRSLGYDGYPVRP